MTLRYLALLLLTPFWALSDVGTPTSYSFLKHREHKGVGYDTGYTSIDVMASPIDFSFFYPFINIRGHVFNDGRFASNFGLAGRFILKENSGVFGANFFYDYRNSQIFSAQQMGAGLEFFKGDLAFRANGYMPIGILKGQDHSHSQVALANIDGEAEIGILQSKNFTLFSALGVYYLCGRSYNNKTFGKAWGSKLRITSTIYKWIEAGIDATYDHIFNFTFQGYLALKIPFGGKNSHLQDLFQPIRRSEIIPLQKESS